MATVTAVANSTINSTENLKIDKKTVKKSDEKKQLGTGGTIALSTGLAALASLGTYVVMRGKNKQIVKNMSEAMEILKKNSQKQDSILKNAKDEIQSLKRVIRSKEELIEETRNKSVEVLDKFTEKAKELAKAQRELNEKNETIKILESQIEKLRKK